MSEHIIWDFADDTTPTMPNPIVRCALVDVDAGNGEVYDLLARDESETGLRVRGRPLDKLNIVARSAAYPLTVPGFDCTKFQAQ